MHVEHGGREVVGGPARTSSREGRQWWSYAARLVALAPLVVAPRQLPTHLAGLCAGPGGCSCGGCSGAHLLRLLQGPGGVPRGARGGPGGGGHSRCFAAGQLLDKIPCIPAAPPYRVVSPACMPSAQPLAEPRMRYALPSTTWRRACASCSCPPESSSSPPSRCVALALLDPCSGPMQQVASRKGQWLSLLHPTHPSHPGITACCATAAPASPSRPLPPPPPPPTGGRLRGHPHLRAHHPVRDCRLRGARADQVGAPVPGARHPGLISPVLRGVRAGVGCGAARPAEAAVHWGTWRCWSEPSWTSPAA